MAKEKAPKTCAKYDPEKDPLKDKLPFLRRPTISDLILLLKVASTANEVSGGKAWNVESPFQRKIEELIGPRPYGAPIVVDYLVKVKEEE